MATFYFNGAVDIAAELPPDWQTLGNWWMNSAHTVAATALPTSSDSVIASASIDANSGSEPTVVNLTMQGGSALRVSITATGVATFDGGSLIDVGHTVTGNCVFSGNQSRNRGTITGDCTFNNGSYNVGTITGDCTFNGGSYVDWGGTVNGDCVFNNISRNFGTIAGDCTFSNGSYNGGTISGHGEFNDTCENGDSVIPGYGNCGTATFNDNSSNYGSIGTATFNDGSMHRSASSVGNATFNDSSRTVDSQFQPLLNNATFNDNSRCVGASVGDCTFNDNSRMEQGSYFAYISGTATFRGNSANIMGCYGSVIVQHGGGINGSSILGVL